MDYSAWVGLSCFIGMFALVMLGIPIVVSMLVTAVVGFWLIGGTGLAFQQFGTAPYFVSASYMLAVIPLFILMGTIAGKTGIAKSSYDAVNKWVGGLRGGTLIATVLAGALFGACCGLGVASAAVFATIALPELQKQKYNKSLSMGAICLSGSLSGLIPPSIGIVIIAILTEQSIGRALVALIIPGALLALFASLAIWLMGTINPKAIPKADVQVSWKEKLLSLRLIWPVLFLFIIVIGGMYLGIFPPTVAGAIGAAGVLIYAVVLRVRMRTIASSFHETILINAQLFPLVLSGFLFARLIAISGLPGNLTDLITAAGLSPYMLMLVIVILYLIIGSVFEFLSMAIVTFPLIFPILVAAGFDPIAVLIIISLLGEMAALTPPIGLTAFVVAGVAKARPEEVFLGIIPFFLIGLALLWLIVFFPQLATWLPNLFYGAAAS
jgi:C4-dicarboxylate transporter, DctM subunit